KIILNDNYSPKRYDLALYRLFEFDLFCLTRFEGIRNTFSELEVEAFIAKRLVNINYLSKSSRIGI
ncbi:hypothetical protein, partial [Legionella pneumophila]